MYGYYMCKKINKHIINSIELGSIAEEMELEPGDELISINGQEIGDVFDYHYLIHDEYLVALFKKANGEEWELEIEKDYDEDLGIEFENGLMDDYKSCQNKCIFCFIDQMPKGMRETLYFKDDDSRLSFLQGNYVTLTNMKEADLQRIINYKLEPINVSVQTTNPELRCMMLHNRFAGEALKKIDTLFEGGVHMNGQIVLCKGVNDGAELERSISDLVKYLPLMESVSVVPVGLSKYREGLYPLEPFTKEDAIEVLEMIHKWQNKCMETHGTHFIHASDEWYLLAEKELPDEENYDGYLQLENGVGMLRLLMNEFEEAMQMLEEDIASGDFPKEDLPDKENVHRVTLVTGRLAGPFLKELADKCQDRYSNYTVDVVEIRNDFFGEMITVSGLLTGQDLKAQILEYANSMDEETGSKRGLGESVLIPCNMLRSGEEVFLDDMTVTELEEALGVPITIVESSGQALLNAMLFPVTE